MKLLLRVLLIGLAAAFAACGSSDATADQQAIRALLHAQFDREGTALAVDPVAVAGEHAIAGWTQGESGGRALLRKRDGAWALVLCAGDGIRGAAALQRAGVPAGYASQLARDLARAESDLSPQRLAQLARFQGVVHMDEHGLHPSVARADATSGLVLDAAGSQLTFVSIKNNTVAETHRFAMLSGAVSESGEGKLEIALDSVQTGIALRDQRMRELLFETARFPTATVTLAVNLAAIRALAPGAHQVTDTTARLTLHGIDNRLPVSLRITRTDAGSWLVTSEKPVIVNATNHGLINGVEALRKVVGLQGIGSGVPVSFALRFVSEAS